MSDEVKDIVRTAVEELINETMSPRQISKHFAVHEAKLHFVPVRYRVLQGLLQSLSIKFGNFIEKLIALVVERDTCVDELPASGKKIRLLTNPRTDTLIDEYITARQQPNSPDQCDTEFQTLLNTIFQIESQSSDEEKNSVTRDVDALFKTQDGEIVYLEIKYNDDHDTGKFVDINRKFLKTYAGLIGYLEITDISMFTPILYYLNPTKRYGPIYTPSSNIYRGNQLFEHYFEIKYSDIDFYLRTIGEDPEVLALFDEAYKAVRYTHKRSNSMFNP